MTAYKTLLILFINFIYGIVFFYLAILNYKFFFKDQALIKILMFMLFTIDNVFIYLVIIYKLNYGIFHIYYLFCFVGGFLLANYLKNKMLNLCKILTKKKKIC